VVAVPRPSDAESLAAEAVDWLLAQARTSRAGLVWNPATDGPEVDPTPYHGCAGIVLALLEAHRHFEDDRCGEAALRGALAIAAEVEHERARASHRLGNGERGHHPRAHPVRVRRARATTGLRRPVAGPPTGERGLTSTNRPVSGELGYSPTRHSRGAQPRRRSALA